MWVIYVYIYTHLGTIGSMGSIGTGFGGEMKRKSVIGARSVPTVSEAQIQAETVQLLQKAGIFCHSVPNEGAGSDMIRTTQLIALGLRKGVADLVVWWPDGIGYLEMKRPGGVQSKEQQAFERKCREYGVAYDLAHSIEEVEAILEWHRRKA